MICWMSEGITVRAELASGMDHAVALSIKRTLTPPLSIFIETSRNMFGWMRRILTLYVNCAAQSSNQDARKCHQKGGFSVVNSSTRQLSGGFPPQMRRLSATPD